MLNAPQSQWRFTIVREIGAGSDRVFQALTSEAGMRAWVPACRDAAWRHPAGVNRPGVGSLRHLTLAAGMSVDEGMLAWEEGHGLHYGFVSDTMPLAVLTKNYMGATTIEPLGPEHCRLHWAVHFDAPGAKAVLAPLLQWAIRPLIAGMARRLGHFAETAT